MIIQGWKTLGPASDTFIRLVTQGRLRHDDNPVTNMCLRNTIGERDRSSVTANVKPGRIQKDQPNDGTVAMIETLADMEIELPSTPGVTVFTADDYDAAMRRAMKEADEMQL